MPASLPLPSRHSFAFDELSFPTIIDQIFAYSSRDALLVLRQVSRSWRDRADARFVTHVSICQRSTPGHSVALEMRGPLGVIPRKDWYETSVGDSTRVLDLGSAGGTVPAGLCRLRKIQLLRDHGYVMRNRTPLPPARTYLMNRVGVDTFAQPWSELVISLPYFQPTFVPLENAFGSHGAFPKSLAGQVSNVRGSGGHRPRPAVLASSLSFGDNGRASHLGPPTPPPHPRVNSLGVQSQYTGFVIPLSRPSRSFHIPGAFTIILARPPPGFAPRPPGVCAGPRTPRRADDYEGTFRNMTRRIAKILAEGNGRVPITLVNFEGWFVFLPNNRISSYESLMDEIRTTLADFLKCEDIVDERMADIAYLSMDEYRMRVGNERFVLETEFAETMGPALDGDDQGRMTWTTPSAS